MFDTPDDARAAFKRGLILIGGQSKEPLPIEFETGRHLIAKAAETFPAAAALQAALDAMHMGGVAADSQVADTFLKAAISGYPAALRGLAVIMLSDLKTQALGAGLLRRAVQGGDWIAAFLLLREACRGRVLASRDEMAPLSAQLTGTVPFCANIAAAIANINPDQEGITPEPFTQARCRAGLLDALAAVQGADKTQLCADPEIVSFRAALSPLECDYLIAVSSPLMQPSKVVDAKQAGAVSAGYRTSDGAVLLPVHMDLVTVIISRKLARAAKIAPEQGEFLSLLRYRPGQQYLPHHDYLKPDAQDYSRIKSCGQRKRTVLTYLNEDYEGGETAFPKLDLSYKGKAGDSLRFANVDDRGKPIPDSLHAGMPVTQGEKWLATLWCREKPFWPWMREP